MLLEKSLRYLHRKRAKQPVVKTRELISWKVDLMVSYCCDIPDNRDMLLFTHSIVVKKT